MTKTLSALVAAVLATAVAGQALALNPQPLPPMQIKPLFHGNHAAASHHTAQVRYSAHGRHRHRR